MDQVRSGRTGRGSNQALLRSWQALLRSDVAPHRSKQEVVEALLYAAVLTLLCSRTLLALLRHKQPEHADRFRERRTAAVFAAIAWDLLLLIVRPPRGHQGLEAELSGLLLHESLDPHRSRPALLTAIETRRHAYRSKAA